MSKQTYLAGFCKAAAARGVNPEALARFAIQKEAQDSNPDIWAKVLKYIKNAKDMWNILGPSTQSAISGLAGSAIGTGLGASIGGTKGLVLGAIVGAIAGAGAPHVDWRAVIDSFKNRRDKKLLSMGKKMKEKDDLDVTFVNPDGSKSEDVV